MYADKDDPDWEDLGRHLLEKRLAEGRYSVEDAFRNLEEALRSGDPLDEDDVRAARSALRLAWRVLEDETVPVAEGDLEPHERPPDAPMGKVREWARCECHDAEPEADR